MSWEKTFEIRENKIIVSKFEDGIRIQQWSYKYDLEEIWIPNEIKDDVINFILEEETY